MVVLKLEFSGLLLKDEKKNNHNNDNINDNKSINKHQKSLICIYTNKDKNEFAIGLKDDEHFREKLKRKLIGTSIDITPTNTNDLKIMLKDQN